MSAPTVDELLRLRETARGLGMHHAINAFNREIAKRLELEPPRPADPPTLSDETEEQGCTCSASPRPPCAWCENAPDPDSEAGLRREVNQLRVDKDSWLRERDRLRGRVLELERLLHTRQAFNAAATTPPAPPPESVTIHPGSAIRMKVTAGIASVEVIDNLAAVRVAALAVALACVAQLAAERQAGPKGPDRFSYLEL